MYVRIGNLHTENFFPKPMLALPGKHIDSNWVNFLIVDKIRRGYFRDSCDQVQRKPNTCVSVFA